MRLFRRARDTKTSVIRREAVSAVVEAVPMRAPLAPPSSPVAAVIVDDVDATAHKSSSLSALVPESLPSYEHLDESDVFVKPQPVSSINEARSTVKAPREVTLFVHGWDQVEPGLLSWTFPSLRAALDSVQRMKNAIGWCVVSGTGWTDLEAARANGAILVEQLA